MNKYLLLILLTIFFSFLLFILKEYFFGYINSELKVKKEDIFIEHYSSDNKKNEDNENTEQIVSSYLKSVNDVKITYIPSVFRKEIFQYSHNFKSIIDSKDFSDFIYGLNIELYKKKHDVRGKMKNKTIKLFGIKQMSHPEFISVGIHELAHYIDLYFLNKKVLVDRSDYFYNISWNSTKIIKAGMEQKDFVSGYAMTNKYEDFAESFTYYVLHNESFRIKSLKSDILKSKYIFFSRHVFREGEFVQKKVFLDKKKIKDYYWDITKIDFSLDFFLEYLKR